MTSHHATPGTLSRVNSAVLTRNSYTRQRRRPKEWAWFQAFTPFGVGKQVALRQCVRLGTFALAVALIANLTALRAAQDPTGQHPTYRGGISMVSVSAVVRKHNGQWVTGLTQNEFEVLDNGAPRAIEA